MKFMKSLCVGLLVSLLAVGAFAETIVVDNRSDAFTTSGTWNTGTYAGYHVTDYRSIATELTETATASWAFDGVSAGIYEVAVWYVQGSNRATDAKFTVHHDGGSTNVSVDQTTNGAQWFVLGSYSFPASGGSVTLSNQAGTAGKAVIADAVRFVRQGTTYGDAYQAMWIYSWGAGILSESQTGDMIGLARANNLNAIFPQVRKTGDAYYISSTEPFASNIEAGYEDPLADIIAKAHDTSGGKQYIEVHAWIVPYRVGGSATPPGHVILEHPEWMMADYDGTVSTVYLDPGIPEVTDYLVDVVTEIVENYDVDGIHFDYFRYPGTSYGYNATSLARFHQLYNRSDRPLPNDAEFCDFRRDQIRQMGRKVYASLKAIRWDVNMSAATVSWLPSPPSGNFQLTRPYYDVFQDWPSFMEEGLLDMNVVMNYMREHNTAQAAGFRGWTDCLASTKAGRHAVSGPGVYMNSIHNSVTQVLYGLDTPGIDGTNFYVYHLTNMDGDSAADFWATMRADCFTQRRNVPAAPWIDSPTQGILKGTVTVSGSAVDGGTVTLSGGASGTIQTDGTGFYAFLKLDAGTSLTATASLSGYSDQSKNFDIAAGAVTTLDFAFGESTPTPTLTSTETPTETPTPSATQTATQTQTPVPYFELSGVVYNPQGTPLPSGAPVLLGIDEDGDATIDSYANQAAQTVTSSTGFYRAIRTIQPAWVDNLALIDVDGEPCEPVLSVTNSAIYGVTIQDVTLSPSRIEGWSLY